MRSSYSLLMMQKATIRVKRGNNLGNNLQLLLTELELFDLVVHFLLESPHFPNGLLDLTLLLLTRGLQNVQLTYNIKKNSGLNA